MNKSFEQSLERLFNVVDQHFNEILADNTTGSKDSSAPFANPDEYRKATGRRFRMTREQKARGITRQEAFAEFLQAWTPDKETK